MSGRQRRQVVVMLTREEWLRLAEMATAAERDPYQQARWLLLGALRAQSETQAAPVPAEPDTADVA